MSSLARKHAARHAVAASLFLALLSSAPTKPGLAQTRPQQRYIICVGTASEKLASGTLWLYSYSYYGGDHLELATIRNGVADVPLDLDRLKTEYNPFPNADAYVLVIQASEHFWYRSPEIAPARFWTDVPGAMRSLGKTTDLPAGETQLILAPARKRHITLLYPDGRPKSNTEVDIDEFLTNQNHCGAEDGLPLGKFRTDGKGTIEVLAPPVILYLALEYYDNVGTGPAGTAYSQDGGIKVGPEEEAAVLKKQWDLPRFTVQLQVLTSAGQPRPDVNIWANWNTNGCGGGDQEGQTDENGMIQIVLDQTYTGITLMIGGPYPALDPTGERSTGELTDAELRELFSKHNLVIRWDPVPKPATEMLARPLGYWTSVPVNCDSVSGKWADPENRLTWTWNLNQTGEDITGSLTILKGSNCGSITWQVAGHLDSRVASLTATKPEPSVDKCGNAATASITAIRAPYCGK